MTTVEVQVCTESGTTDVAVSVADDTSVAEVFAALALPPATTVDGLTIPSPSSTAAVDALAVGATLAVQKQGHLARTDDRVDDRGVVEVSVVAGLDAGASARLRSGLFHVSPTGECSDGSWLFEVGQCDPALGLPQPWQQHGSSVEVVAASGPALLAVSRPVDPESAQSTAIHRPPRRPAAVPPAPIVIGDLPEPVREPSPLSWATLLAPIPVAILMAVFFRPLFALFAAMGPVMALGRWWESRRRHRKATAERSVAVANVRRDVTAQVKIQAEAEAQRRWLDDPHVGALMQRAADRSVRLWERRPGTDGFLRATLGVGPVQCPASFAESNTAEEFPDLVAAPLLLRAAQHTVDFAAEPGVGLWGQRDHTLAVARSLIAQLATLHGPADLRLGVVCSPAHASDWDWIKWLPHLDRSLVGHRAGDVVDGVSQTEPEDGASPAARLLIVDARQANVARLVRAADNADIELRVLAVAADPITLPAVCSTTVAVDDTPSMVPTGISDSTARTWVQHLARLHDPEAAGLDKQERARVSLLQIVGQPALVHVQSRWASRSAAQSPVVTVGQAADGPFRLDLTNDGPHALVAGTTGSGKSELLRSMVAGLALACPPEHLNFVLVDFKGGGAFDVVRDLPHIAGMITDLDEALVERALISLRAELERREHVFRSLGVSCYEDAVGVLDSPMARLVIVIDEFAVLATDYSELMTSIIDLAARGRSLGMHLVLATQRPSGVVDQKIRANTNLRIALRVQDAFDSQDVVGVPDAADIDRKTPGRAIVCIGGDRAVDVQMAFTGAPDRPANQCVVRPHTLFKPAAADDQSVEPPAARTELAVIVDAIVRAAASETTTRALWAPPLPAVLDWIDLGARGLSASAPASGFALGLADLPAQQSQEPWRWNPETGSLGVYAASGACAGKILVSLGAAMASTATADELHLYVVDGDAGATSVLEQLPHTGAYVRMGELDRVERLVRFFEQRLGERRSARSVGDAQLVLMIDNIATVLAALDDGRAAMFVDRLGAIARDGSQLGVHLVVSARTPRDISHRLAQQIPNRLVLAMADTSAYLTLGLKLSDVVPLPSMRAIDVGTRHIVQLVEPPDLASWSTSGATAARSAPPVRSFPETVGADELEPVAIASDGTLHIPLGLDSVDLGQARLSLRPGENGLIVGAPGMGRSTALLTLAQQLDQHDVAVVSVAPHRSPLTDGAIETDSTRLAAMSVEAIDAVAPVEVRTVVIVDDADALAPDVAAALERLVEARSQHLHIVAATTPDAARSVRSWTNKIRAGGVGLLLGCAPSDGEIFRVRLGQLDGCGTLPGRGYIIARGRTFGVQLGAPNAGS